jgi:hypothetical protein
MHIILDIYLVEIHYNVFDFPFSPIIFDLQKLRGQTAAPSGDRISCGLFEIRRVAVRSRKATIESFLKGPSGTKVQLLVGLLDQIQNHGGNSNLYVIDPHALRRWRLVTGIVHMKCRLVVESLPACPNETIYKHYITF